MQILCNTYTLQNVTYTARISTTKIHYIKDGLVVWALNRRIPTDPQQRWYGVLRGRRFTISQNKTKHQAIARTNLKIKHPTGQGKGSCPLMPIITILCKV